MKTLYVCDLDGTLLDDTASLPSGTTEILQRLLAQGLPFTIATGRTPVSVHGILASLPLHLPAIYMNGALLHCPQTKMVLDSVPLAPKAKQRLFALEREIGVKGFHIGNLENDLLFTLGENNALWEWFFVENKAVVSIENGLSAADFAASGAGLLYAIYIAETPVKLHSLYRCLAVDPRFHVDFYQDVYHDNLWCLEAYSAEADKGQSLRLLKAHTGAKRIVVFGDNLNDLPLFEAADEAYAVANARSEVKAAASGIIGSHLADSVATFLQQNWRHDA